MKLDLAELTCSSNIEIKANIPEFHEDIYEFNGEIINSKILKKEEKYYWFIFVRLDKKIKTIILTSKSGIKWDIINHNIPYLNSNFANIYIDNDFKIIYILNDKKNRPQYYQYISNDGEEWVVFNITYDYIGLIYHIEHINEEYFIYSLDDDIVKQYITKDLKLIDKNKYNIFYKGNINNLYFDSTLNLFILSFPTNQTIILKNGKQYNYIKSDQTFQICGIIQDIDNHDYIYCIENKNNNILLKSYRNLKNRILFTSGNGILETDFILVQSPKQIWINSQPESYSPSIKVGIMDKNNKFVDNYSLDNAIQIDSSSIRRVMAWGDKAYFTSKDPIIVKLVIELENSLIYDIEFSDFWYDCAGNVKQQTKSNDIETFDKSSISKSLWEDCAGNVKQQTKSNDIETFDKSSISKSWWQNKPIVVFSGCAWGSTGGAQRPVALCREFVKLGIPVIYCSYANKNSELLFIDGVSIVPSNRIIETIEYLSFNNIIGICLVTLANYYKYAEILNERGWSIVYDMLDDWDAFFDRKELLPDPDFREQDLINISQYITCSSSLLVDRSYKISPHNNIKLIRNGGINTIYQKTVPTSDMISNKLPMSIYCGYLAGKWIDWKCFEILCDGQQIINVIGDIYDAKKEILYPKTLENQYIKFLGEKQFTDAMNYIAASHVGLIPFQYDDICNAVDPVKMYDYWAAGLWVVATPPMKELYNRDYIIIAEKQDWPEAIKDAYNQVKNGNVPSPAFIQENSWESRAIQFKEVINAVKPTKKKTYRVSNRPYLKEEYNLRLTVEAPSSCNMKPYCPYCANADSRDSKDSDFCGDPNKWLDSLSWLSEEYGPLYLTTCYGEPLSSLTSIHLYAEIAKGNLVDIVSNIIAPLDDIKLLPVNGNVRFATSFHPHYWSVDQFIEKRLAIQDAGYHCGVTLIVAYPPYISKLKEWKKKIEDIGSTVEILTFYGKFQGKEYPINYTEKEKEIVLSYQNIFNKREDSELINKTLGKKCWAGSKYIFINWNGDVMQCPAHGVRKLGNIIERDFELFDEPQTCIAEFCGCADMWRYIVDD